MSQTFNLGGLGDNKLTKLIFSNGTANTCSIFLDNDGYLVFEQGANTVTFPLGELPADKRLAIENGIVVEGRDVVDKGNVDDDDDNQNNLVVDLTEDALTNAVADALGVENLFSAKSEPKPEDGVYPGFANAMYFNGSSNYLSKVFRSPTDASTWTYSFWVKRTTVSSSNTQMLLWTGPFGSVDQFENDTNIGFTASNKFQWYSRKSSSESGYVESSASYEDTSAWYHFVVSFEPSSMKFYANGDRITALDRDDSPSSAQSLNTVTEHRIGNRNYSEGYNYLNAHMANIQFIDGQVLDASAFGQYLQVDGEESNIWIPKPLDPSINYGANGFYLDFSRNRLDSNGDIDMVHDVAPIQDTGHTAANDWTAN